MIQTAIAASEKSRTNGDLSPNQLYEIYCYVRNSGKTTGTIEPPQLPAKAEQYIIDFGLFDSISVWILDGWPIAASDEMTMTHWSIADAVK